MYDLIVIGGGPGGYIAAIRASQLGLKTALVEETHLGGVCLNWGCIPTKALLKAAEIQDLLKHISDFGFEVKEAKFDLKKIVERSRKIAEKLSNGVKYLMKKNNITLYEGRGALAGKTGATHQVKVILQGKETLLKASNVILATGARPRILKGFEPDQHLIWTSKEAMIPEKLPKSLLIMGSGAIGVEFASFYQAFGSQVTVVEIQDRILPAEDAEVSKLAQKAFEKRGIKFYIKTQVEKLEKSADSLEVTLKKADGKSEKLTADRLIVAAGIVGNVESLGLESTKVQVKNTHIETNEWCETAEPGIYAIGDVAGAPWLAHKASHEGIIVVEKIMGRKNVHPLNPKRVPGCTYSTPQIASIGFTEDQAKEAGYSLKVGRFSYAANGKAMAIGEDQGLIKTIFDEKTGELLGAHIIGAEATEMIQGYAIAQTLETTEEDLLATIFPHPTLSEMMHESVLDAYGRALNF